MRIFRAKEDTRLLKNPHHEDLTLGQLNYLGSPLIVKGTLLMLDESPHDAFEEINLADQKPFKEGFLSFNLDDYESRESFDNATRADTLQMQVDSYYDEVIRTIYKYDTFKNKPLTPDQYELLEHLIKELGAHFSEN